MAKVRVPTIDKKTAEGIKKLEKVYISDVCILVAGGDYKLAGLLSTIIYWITPNSKGNSKLRIEREGKMWISKSNADLSKESKLPLRDVKTRKAKAINLGYIEAKYFRFNNIRTTHIWVRDEFLQVVSACERWVSANHLPRSVKEMEEVLEEIKSNIQNSDDHDNTTTNRKKRKLRRKPSKKP